MKEKLTVIKVGGKIVEEEATLNQLLQDFSAIEGYKVLVHGGGRSATKLAAQLGIGSRMVNGRRITDAETLKVVTMVYGGLVNKNIVAGLQSKGVNAIGLTGADMNVIRSVKRPVKDVDYGFVGDVEEVNAELLANLIRQGVVPVMAPLTVRRRADSSFWISSLISKIRLDAIWYPPYELKTAAPRFAARRNDF